MVAGFMVNYPNGKKSGWSRPAASAADRGMDLEDDINTSNRVYLSEDRALIYKKPTPVQVVKVDYPERKAAKITEAYYKVPSTTDYNGIYRGKYIDFEAKECASKTSFSLHLIHDHQLEHLEKVTKMGGIAFVIVRFTHYFESYLVPEERINTFKKEATRKSIPYLWFKEHGYPIPYNYLIPVDYLGVIDRLYFKQAEEMK